MFLNQVNDMWRDLGRANPNRALLLMLLPALVFVVLALPEALSEGPVADQASWSGPGITTGGPVVATGEQAHLSGSYQVTISVLGPAGCSSSVELGGYAFGVPTVVGAVALSGRPVTISDTVFLSNGLYAVTVTATGCGPWTVSLDRG